MLKRITALGVSRLVGASWVRRPGRTFCPQLIQPSSHRKIRYYKRKKGHIHNQSSRISRNKSAHRLESAKHSICCCWIILFAALSLSIVVYCRLCCSLILPAIYWGRTKSSAISKVAKAKNTNVHI